MASNDSLDGSGAGDAGPLQQELRRSGPGSGGFTDVFLERSACVTVRHVNGQVADRLVTRRAGSSVRRVDASGAVYEASGEPTLVREVLGPRPPAPEVAGELVRLDALLRLVEQSARAVDDRIRQVLIDAELGVQDICVVGPEDVRHDRRNLLYLTVRVIAEQAGRRATGFLTAGTSSADGALDGAVEGRAAAERALLGLSARPAPVAHLPVIVGPGRGTVLIHEACCHPLEGDEVERGSVYAARMGELIASPGLSIVDDSTVPDAVGSYRVDDDGTGAAATTLVDAGRLASFLTDRVSSHRLGLPITPNGRRDGFAHRPIPRMSNTCVLPGELDPADIIADTEFGLYAPHVGGGEVIESTGDFVFRVMNGYLIVNGRITDPVSETTVCGNGAEVLATIDAVGTDFEVGTAKCGKFGQVVPVGVCGPTLRIRSLLVGGVAG